MVFRSHFSWALSRLVFLVLLCFSLLLSQASNIAAQSSGIEIKSFEIRTLADDRVITDTTSLSAGTAYRILFTVNVGPGIKEPAKFQTELGLFKDRYWTLLNSYEGIDTNTWQPGQPQFEFNASKSGSFNMELQGVIPRDFIEIPPSNPGGETLHKSKSINLLKGSFISGSDFMQPKSFSVTDVILRDYISLIDKLDADLAKTNANGDYIKLVSKIRTLAVSSADNGYATRAIQLLQIVPPADEWPGPSPNYKWLWIVLGILAFLIVVLLILIIRQKDTSASILKDVRAEANELEKALIIINQTCPPDLVDDIEKIKNRLKEIGG
jgi:hypothetical protein